MSNIAKRKYFLWSKVRGNIRRENTLSPFSIAMCSNVYQTHWTYCLTYSLIFARSPIKGVTPRSLPTRSASLRVHGNGGIILRQPLYTVPRQPQDHLLSVLQSDDDSLEDFPEWALESSERELVGFWMVLLASCLLRLLRLQMEPISYGNQRRLWSRSLSGNRP